MKQIRANEQIKQQLPHTPGKKKGKKEETGKIVPFEKSLAISVVGVGGKKDSVFK